MPVVPVIIANTGQVRTNWTLASGQSAITVVHFRLTVPLTAALATNIGLAVRGAWITHLQALCAASTIYVSSEVTDLRTVGGPSFPINYGNAGTGAGDAIPTMCAAVVSWYTDKRGKSYRGRSYLPGFNEAQSAGANLLVSTQTALNNYGTKLRTDLAALGTGLVVASRKLGTSEPVTAHTVRSQWKLQNRRKGLL